MYHSRYRAMFDVLAMPMDWPVEVNYHEAKAFCSWKGPSYRLLTEAEHHRIRDNPVREMCSHHEYLYRDKTVSVLVALTATSSESHPRQWLGCTQSNNKHTMYSRISQIRIPLVKKNVFSDVS